MVEKWNFSWKFLLNPCCWKSKQDWRFLRKNLGKLPLNSMELDHWTRWRKSGLVVKLEVWNAFFFLSRSRPNPFSQSLCFPYDFSWKLKVARRIALKGPCIWSKKYYFSRFSRLCLFLLYFHYASSKISNQYGLKSCCVRFKLFSLF